MIKTVKTISIVGIKPVPVTVECEVSKGIGIHVIGLADAAVKESLLRTVTALQAAGYSIPGEHVIINLAPADLRKSGPGYDLPIAMALIAAAGKEELPELDRWTIIGELGLDGSVRQVSGTIQAVMSAAEAGAKGVIIPGQCVHELDGLGFPVPVYPVDYLKQAISAVADTDGAQLLDDYLFHCVRDIHEKAVPPLWDAITDHKVEKRGIEIAAAGGHNVLLVGDQGTDKGVLAKAMLDILPPMTREETVETASVFSVAGRYNSVGERPFRAPHSSCSMASMLGGGYGGDILPGEVSLAHNGILFIDEANLMPKSMQEALRGPLEDREIKISRLRSVVTYPANFRFVAAMDQCPCGRHDTEGACTCTDTQRGLFISRLSGPVYDRLAVQIYTRENTTGTSGPTAAETAERVRRALAVQKERYKDEPYDTNDGLDIKGIEKYCRMDDRVKDLLEKLVNNLGLSARCYSQAMRIARTIADLEGSETIKPAHMAEAVAYRFLDKRPV